MNAIGKQVKILRQKQQMSQKLLEERSGIKREYISKIEQGQLKNPTLNTMNKIAQGLGVPLESLLPLTPKVPHIPELTQHIKNIDQKIGLLNEDMNKLREVLHLINNRNTKGLNIGLEN